MENPFDETHDVSFSQGSSYRSENNNTQKDEESYNSVEFLTDEEPPELPREIVEFGIEDAANSDGNWIANTLGELFEDKSKMLELFILENFYHNTKNTHLFPKFAVQLFESGLQVFKTGLFHDRSKIRNDLTRYRKVYLDSFKHMMLQCLQNIAKQHTNFPYGHEQRTTQSNWMSMMSQSMTPPNSPPLITGSRFNQYFEVIKVLGRGGFGQVFEAKNKLDGVAYALKQIKLKEKDVSMEKILREVKALARLEHKNVCRYYNSWIEPWEDKGGMTTKHVEALLRSGSNSSDSSSISFESSEESNPGRAVVPYKNKINNYYFVLFIQMQLYEGKTLKDLLECENRQVDRQKNLNIFKQIVEGLDHIHCKKIIHRDVKPGNIFIANDGTVKIGDFGLSTLQEQECSEENSGPDGEWLSELTTGIGTRSYSSPEQLAGNSFYTFKTDIFSCGLILFELFHPFNTMSEKAHVFRDLRNGHVPPKLLKQYPNESAMILWLMSPNPNDRPSTSEILSSPLLQQESGDEITVLKETVAKHEATISEQQKRIQELEEQLASLKLNSS